MSQDENMTMVDWIEAERVRKSQQKTVYDPALDQSRGKWTRCDQCGEILYIKHIRLEHMVCSKCEFPLQMRIQDRIHMLLDQGSWRPMDEWLSPADPMSFYDSRPYTERLLSAQEETGLQDAVQTGTGLMEGMPLALGVMDFNFMGGSMGSVVGEKITRLIEHATKHGLPLLLITASGGARMQEGVLSLMQMAKISAALHVHQNCAQLPYWSLLTHPTTGGVTASFAMLGDLVLAEPRAMIAFAGRRVIQETLGEVLPENFQTAEYLMEHGLLDLIIERRYHREAFAELVLFHQYAPRRKRGHLPHGYNGPMTLVREERLRRALQLGQATFEPLLQSFQHLLRRRGNEEGVKRDELLQTEIWLQAQKEGVLWNVASQQAGETRLQEQKREQRSAQIQWQGWNRPTWPEWPTDAELEPITLPDGRLQYPITSDVQREPMEVVESELETLERAIWRATCAHLRTTQTPIPPRANSFFFPFVSMTILVENVSKSFGQVPALRNVQLEIPRGSLTRLVGPSGSGKSTLLRLVAGFETPDQGEIWLNQKKVTTVAPGKREIGVVFQNYALFPHLTVRENVEFGLLQRNPSISQDERTLRVQERLQLVRLLALAERYPNQLSGGQKQRVALARALVLEPQVLLLDEPFAALDPKVRCDLRDWLRRLHDEVAVTTLLVTHDQQEAMEVADQVVVFRRGRVEQVAAPLEIYDFPANPFVMSFVGTAQLTPTPEKGRFGLVRPHEVKIQPIPRPDPDLAPRHDQRQPSRKWQLEKVIYGETLVQLDVLNPQNQKKIRVQSTRKQVVTWKTQKIFENGFFLQTRKNE